MPQICPVIHVKDQEQSLRCAAIAAAAGCEAIFLISMSGDDDVVDAVSPHIRKQHPSMGIGVNYLTHTSIAALLRSQRLGYDATWTDQQEFANGEITPTVCTILSVKRPGHLFFSAVAFKGQPTDPTPGDSAAAAAFSGLIPTTSGAGTGIAPDVGKIIQIRRRMHPADPLAIASGVTPENVNLFAPYVTHVLVATGISKSFYEFDADKLDRLMKAVK